MKDSFFELIDEEKIIENEKENCSKWKVLVVDDDIDVQQITKLTFEDFKYKNLGLTIMCASNSVEAKRCIIENQDLAVIFLDIVMEEDDTGLKLVKFIRERNKLVRIIIRTGHPGRSFDENIVIDYDINYYIEKNELTAKKFHISMITSLRAYEEILEISNNKKNFERYIELSGDIFKNQKPQNFYIKIISSLCDILQIDKYYSYVVSKNYDKMDIIQTSGNDGNLNTLDKISIEILKSNENKNIIVKDNFIICHIKSQSGKSVYIAINHSKKLSNWDKNFLEIFTTTVSVSYENILLNTDIDLTQNEILWILGEIAEARSQETGFHVKRVAEYSKILALKSGISQEQAELLSKASPLHDIGKIGIKDYILNKKSSLNFNEFELIKMHTTFGYNMLRKSNSKVLQMGAIIALQHHERFDGNGYPNNLSGKEIHVFSRITAIADVFDALICERVYKKAWDVSKILKYFNEQKGKQFDPILIDLFLNNFEEFIRIKNNFPDNLKG